MSRVVDLGALDSSGLSGFVVQGDSAGDGAGLSVSAVGDFNGDGFDDFIVGAPMNDLSGANSGAAYLIYGHAGGFGDVDLGNLQPSQGFLIDGTHAGDIAGISVSGAGDINGDGFDDLIVGAAGRGLLGYGFNLDAFVIFGRATQPGTIDLLHMTAATGFSVLSGIGTGYTGTVASAGDINGDGFADIILGSRYDNGHAGAAYVIFGKAAGWGSIDVSNLGANGFVIKADTDQFNVGASVASAGDVNGDGFDDLLVTADRSGFYHYGTTPSAYVIFGKAGGFTTVDLSNLTASDGFAVNGQYDYYGQSFTVAGAGDVNGDGFDDILIGSIHDNHGGGAAYVIFGHAGGFGNIDLAHLAASAGFTITGQDLTGFAVSSAGDVNGDGFDDIVIGAPLADGGGTNAGAAYVIFGHAGGFAPIDLANLSATDGFIIQGGAAGDRAGFSVSRGGDINGDGAADLIIGAPYGDRGGTDAGQAHVIFGDAPVHRHTANDDFNGDGRSDILWRNDDGRLVDWLGTASGGFNGNASHSLNTVAADWQVAGTGDFNGDGRSDILWRNDDGRLVDWLGTASGGFRGNGAHSISSVATSIHVAGVGDFNGDGRADILWVTDSGRAVDWLGTASGGFAGNAAHSNNFVAAGWQVAGTGDFNGDGISDVLWQNGSRVADWLGNPTGSGGFIGNAVNSTSFLAAGWSVAGTGDFNGDGRDDILLSNSTTGQVTDWLGTASGGFSDNGTHALATLPTGFEVAQIGDFNRDGVDDVLLRNPTTGQITDWLGTGSGGFADNTAHASSTVDTHWHVEPVHSLT